MKIVAVTNLFPNRQQPDRGVFNRQQFAELAKLGELRVVCPVPWVPRGLKRLTASAKLYAEIPGEDLVGGIRTYYPRYFLTPNLGRSLYGWWMFLSLRRVLPRIRREFPFDVVLATWAYPDVFAASLVARALRIPFVAKVHGSDIHVYTRAFWRRRMVAGALKHAAAVVAVSAELKAQVMSLGVDPEKIHVISNGVDPERFTPMDRARCRTQLGLPEEGKRIVFIGNLVPVKGVEILLDALDELPEEVRLSIVGEGPLRQPLAAAIAAHGLAGRVTLVGVRPHEEIPLWLNAADVVCLPSSNEGCPNVVVEALACGRPVVSTRVGGVPELLRGGECGIVVPPNDAHALAEGLRQSLATHWDPQRIPQAVAHHRWPATAEALASLLRAASNGHAAGHQGFSS